MVLAICVSIKIVLKKKDDFHMIFLFSYLGVIWRVSFKGTLNVVRSYFMKTDPIV